MVEWKFHKLENQKNINMNFKLYLFFLFFACKKKKDITPLTNDFYHYSRYLNDNHYFEFYDNKNVLLDRATNWDSISTVDFLSFQNNNILFDKKKIKLPTFSKDFFQLDTGFVVLNTIPRTLGENTKSTDVLTKYDKNFKIVLKKDMGISKYPNAMCFLLESDERLFYISDWFSGVNSNSESESKLVISEIDKSFNILNQKKFENANNDFAYNPIKCMVIESKYLVVVSNMSYFEADKFPFKVEMFDLNLNKKWSEYVDANSIMHLGYLKSKKKIFLVKDTKETSVIYWGLNGEKEEINYHLNTELISATESDDVIFLLSTNNDNAAVTKISLLEDKVEKALISNDVEVGERIKIHLIYRNNQLFLITIDNGKVLLEIDNIKM